MFRFLIDECVSPALALEAKIRGFEAFHVSWLNMDGFRDTSLAAFALDSDAIIVTNNGSDFHPIYKLFQIHPGLIVIVPSCQKDQQIRLFSLILDRLEQERDIVNKLVEIDIDGRVTVREFPTTSDD